MMLFLTGTRPILSEAGGQRTIAYRPSTASALVSTIAATTIAAAALLPLLGHKILASRDEAIYAEVAREMLRHSWLMPMWHFHLWPEKPPLAIWLTAICFHIFGVNAFAARLVSALSGIGIVGVVHRQVARLRDLKTAWLTTIILLTTLGFLHVCARGEMDAPLTLACLFALIGLQKARRSDVRGWYLFWVAFAAAVMIKGAASITLLLTLIVLLLWNRGLWRSRAFVYGLLIFLCMVLPWHLFMLHRLGSGFIEEYLGFHVLHRALSPWGGHPTAWWYYGPALVAYASPWVLLFPLALIQSTRRPDLRELFVFIVAVMTVFSAMSTRAPRYIFPAYPALAWITADTAGEWLQRLNLKTWLVVIASALAICGLCTPLTRRLRSELGGAAATLAATRSDREAPELIQTALQRQPAAADPILLWQENVAMQELPALLFYAHRPMQQIYLVHKPSTLGEAKRYADPEPLRNFVDAQLHIVLLEKRLASEIPADLDFHLIAQDKTLEVGTIQKR